MLSVSTVALSVAAIATTGCAPRTALPRPPPRDATPVEAGPLPAAMPVPPQGPRYLVGEVCLNMHLSRAHLFPRFLVQRNWWSSVVEVVRAPLIEAPQRFTVLGFEGARRGSLVTAIDEAAAEPMGFVGKFNDSGRGACTLDRPGEDGEDVADWLCAAAGGCSLAVAVVADPSRPAIEIAVAESCLVKGRLIADVDGDGRDEAFALAAFLEGATAAKEVRGERRGADGCERQFAWHGRGKTSIDVLGIADIDADGRRELLIAIRAGSSRTVAVYQANQDGTGLDLVAVTPATAWPF